MALFDFIKKTPAAPPPPPAGPTPPGGTPTDQVMTLQAKGISNNQVIQELQKQGFSQTQIYDALNQASTKKALVKGGPKMQTKPVAQPSLARPTAAPKAADTEELIEAIIEEKWKEFRQKMAKEAKWKEDTETRIVKLEQQTRDLKSTLDNLHTAIIGKIGEYDKNLLSVGTEIKAMEKVFQKILPTLADNVAELSKITDRMKGK